MSLINKLFEVVDNDKKVLPSNIPEVKINVSYQEDQKYHKDPKTNLSGWIVDLKPVFTITVKTNQFSFSHTNYKSLDDAVSITLDLYHKMKILYPPVNND